MPREHVLDYANIDIHRSHMHPLLQSNNIMRRFDHAHSIMRRIGRQRIADKKAFIVGELHEKASVTRGSVRNRDLLTLLIRANIAPKGPRLSDEDVLARKCPFTSLTACSSLISCGNYCDE